jgi:hypothetical protein
MDGTARTASETTTLPPEGSPASVTSTDAADGGRPLSPPSTEIVDAQPSNVVPLEQAKGPKKKKLIDSTKLRKEALEAKLRRRVQKLKKGMSLEQLEALVAKLDAEEKAEEAAQVADEAKPAQSSTAVPAKGEAAAPVVSVPAVLPGWPSQQKIDAAKGGAVLCTAIGATLLAKAGVVIDGKGPVAVIKDGKVDLAEGDQLEALTDSLAAVMAKHWDAIPVTPEAVLVVTAICTIAPPLIGRVRQVIAAKKRQKGASA